MENNLVVQSNDLVLATYQMERTDKELVLACISQIDSRPNAPEVTKQTKFTVSVDDIKSLFYGKSSKNEQNVYRDMEQASNRLYNIDVMIELTDERVLRTRFVSGVLFDPKESQITLSFAEDILPYLTQLKANFTKYKLLEISGLSSIHSIRMYELIVMWINQYQHSKEFSIDEFKHVMSITNKYKQFGQLREYVIEKAIEDISANTNYKVSVEYHKKGRGKGFKGLTLNFHKKALDKLTSEYGTLSQATIQSIVDNVQFMNDYNNHPSLSYDGKMHTDAFKREMINIIQREPESFNKPNKGLEKYLPKVKH